MLAALWEGLRDLVQRIYFINNKNNGEVMKFFNKFLDARRILQGVTIMIARMIILLTIIILISSTEMTADTTYVSGTIISQTWTTDGSPYCVVGDIFVASLTIECGVKVVFMGNFIFEIGGLLTAIGTEQDSIIFTKADGTTGWKGIFFNHSTPGTELAYCRIEESTNRGIFIDDRSPLIRNSLITKNSITGGYVDGGGIYCNAPFTLMNCEISNNFVSAQGYSSASGRGGGIFASKSLTLINSIIRGNSISASFQVSYPTTSNSNGGGIYVGGQLMIANSIITGNSVYANAWSFYSTAYSFGGGMYINGKSTIVNSIISHNLCNATGYYRTISGGGIYVNNDTTSLINCTIAYNTNQGINKGSGTASLRNSIIYFNTGGQIANTDIPATYCDVQDGYLGEGNINFNPVFAGSDDLRIVPGSACIDAGDPDSIYNDLCFPPSLGTARNDMGAHGGPYACNWNLPTVPPPVPVLWKPDSSASNQLLTLMLKWYHSATADSYRVQVGTDTSFLLSAKVDTHVMSTSLQIGHLNYGKPYYWRVKAKNEIGESDWSNVWNFKTIDSLPAPILQSPNSGAINLPTTITLRWHPASGASKYLLEVDTSDSFNPPKFKLCTVLK